MAVKLIDEKYYPHSDDYCRTFVMDSDADVSSLPICGAGSIAMVANEGGSVYMANTSGEWRKI